MTRVAFIYRNILAIVAILLVSYAEAQVENCIEVSLEIDKQLKVIDSSYQVLIAFKSDTLVGIINKGSVCFSVLESDEKIDLILKLRNWTLVYPDLPIHFLQLRQGTTWLLGTSGKPFDKEKYSFMRKNMSKAHRADYLIVSSPYREDTWALFKRKSDGSYFLPDKDLPNVLK